jgi:tetratricopeptide (TPR) repeat protein
MTPTGPSLSGNQTAFPLRQALFCHQQGRLEEALGNYHQVLSADPANVEALHGVGILYGQLGRFDEALKFITYAGDVQPNNYVIHFNRGKAFQELGSYEEALRSYDRTIALKPKFVDAYNNRGNVLKELNRYEEALASFAKAIKIKPEFVSAYHNKGSVLLLLKRHQEALACYDKVLALKPDFAEAYNNRGNVLKDLRRYEEALASYDKALLRKPDYAEFYNNRGNTLKELGRYEEALAAYAKAIALKPGYADAHYHLGLLKLLLGDYRQGWPLHEWRWKAGKEKTFICELKQASWLGGRPLAGQTILLHTEQGLGDVIQFARYVPMVEALGATVILGVPASLQALLGTLKGSFTLATKGDELPEFDLHCPLMSLPLAFKTTVDTIPATVPYLSTEPQKRHEWRERLGVKHRPRVGLVWSGNPEHKNDRNRSMALHYLAPLLGLDCEFHSLQKEVRREDRETLAEYPHIRTHDGELNDFADTAALIAELDVVISVDTSVAHVAGALGKPVWILLPFNPDFRWLTERNDSPWYPTARLFRQRRCGDWEGVVADVYAALQSREFADGEGSEPVEMTMPPLHLTTGEARLRT